MSRHQCRLFIALTIFWSLFVCSFPVCAKTPQVLVFRLQEEISPGAARITGKVFDEAEAMNAKAVLIRMNTYGGLLEAADSIRTRILRSRIPVIVLVENNAASAGALIALAAHKIYMLPGSSIGAATVVNESAEAAPDKYQSYMRSMMRSTAEMRGRNPRIAEAMVDGRVIVPGINDSGQVITLTAKEALEAQICNGVVESEAVMLITENIKAEELVNYEVGFIDKLIGKLMHPAISGVLILLMLGGLYYELQHPGIGFPLLIAVTAALLYFAPMYLEGLAENWEILLVFIGVGLIIAELFFIPGFGVAGISGIILLITGLTVSMLPNKGFDFTFVPAVTAFQSIAVILMSMTGVLILFVLTSRVMASSPFFKKFTLSTEMSSAEGYTTAVISPTDPGVKGKAVTDLRPSGKIEIDGVIYIASAESGYIEAGSLVEVVGNRPGLLVKVV